MQDVNSRSPHGEFVRIPRSPRNAFRGHVPRERVAEGARVTHAALAPVQALLDTAGMPSADDLADKLAGRFLVIDGPDGAGKSTQVALLAAWLGERGLDVLTTRDPGGTAIGDRIRAILLDPACGEMTAACETMLYMASRTQLYDEVIAPALARRQCVLCDRWVSSTVAYQAAGGMAPARIRQAYEAALGSAGPDLTLLLDLPAEEGLARLGRDGPHDRIEAKGLTYHRRVREGFLAQARAAPDRWVVLDAAGSPEDVQQRLREAVAAVAGRP